MPGLTTYAVSVQTALSKYFVQIIADMYGQRPHLLPHLMRNTGLMFLMLLAVNIEGARHPQNVVLTRLVSLLNTACLVYSALETLVVRSEGSLCVPPLCLRFLLDALPSTNSYVNDAACCGHQLSGG